MQATFGKSSSKNIKHQDGNQHIYPGKKYSKSITSKKPSKKLSRNNCSDMHSSNSNLGLMIKDIENQNKFIVGNKKI